jgi:dTDP-4-dehydrorhamnose 3,5-epimerase
MMKVRALHIPGVLLFEPRMFGDERGYFQEAWNARSLSSAGFHESFVQDNLVHSNRGVVRALHYQMTRPQGKLVRCVAGEIFDVAVDLRRSSPTYGAWAGEFLDAAQGLALWVPPGFAHGYCVVSDAATVYYKCTQFYEPGSERTLLWNDPAIGIAWPLARLGVPLLNARDASAPARTHTIAWWCSTRSPTRGTRSRSRRLQTTAGSGSCARTSAISTRFVSRWTNRPWM